MNTIERIEYTLNASGLDGEAWLARADELLRQFGYTYVGGPCCAHCRNEGEFGHHFACGYVRGLPPSAATDFEPKVVLRDDPRLHAHSIVPNHHRPESVA